MISSGLTLSRPPALRALLRGPAAVHQQARAGDEGGRGRGEEGDGSAHLFELAEPAQRYAAQHPLAEARLLEEGQEIGLPKPELELALGQPVAFPLYTSTVRGNDAAGDVLQVAPEQLLQLPPLHTILRGGKRSGTKSVPVTLAARCVDGIRANEPRCRHYVENSIGLVTALNPVIGYERSASIAKEALATGGSVYELVLQKGWLTKDRLDDLLSPSNMTDPRQLPPQ